MGKLFGTDGIRDRANQGNMTTELALKLGRAVALFFRDDGMDEAVRPTIVIGRDPRLSGSMLESALAAGICSAGVDVRLLGVGSDACCCAGSGTDWRSGRTGGIGVAQSFF